MKECGILRVKTYSDPSYIFSTSQDLPDPTIYAPAQLPPPRRLFSPVSVS